MVDLLQQQVAIGDLLIALRRRAPHRAAEQFGGGDRHHRRDDDEAERHRRVAIGDAQARGGGKDIGPGVDDADRPGQRARRPAREQRRQHHRREAQGEGRAVTDGQPIERSVQHYRGQRGEQPDQRLRHHPRNRGGEAYSQIEFTQPRHARTEPLRPNAVKRFAT
jgi:hypothetical protein